MDSEVRQPTYEFGEFRLDARRHALISSGGQPVELTPKAFGVLLYLVEHAGQVVAKATLLDAVWPNVVVEESNLTQTVHVLRRALGENPDDHRFIVTVPGRGYRFVAAVQTLRDPEPGSGPVQARPAATPQPSRRRGALVAGALLTVAVIAVGFFATQRFREEQRPTSAGTTHSIAVLPFEDMSPTGDTAYFADGLSEEVLNLLAQMPELRVIARTSSFSFRDSNVDIATIGRTLDVNHVLEGSVRKSGNRVRITAQLVETTTSSHEWSQTFERELDDVFAVQSEIAAAVAQALQLKLGVTSTAPATANAEAHEQFLKGQFFYSRRGPGDLRRALSSYEHAVVLDPRYARAWAGVAAIWSIQISDNLVTPEIGLPRLLEAAQNAIRHDPGMAEGYLRLANYYWLSGDEPRAREHMKRGASLNPNSPLVLGLQAGTAAQKGRYDEAIALQRRVIALDPLSAMYVGNLGSYLYAAGRLEEAKAALYHSLDLSPQSDRALNIVQILVLQQKSDEALAFVERATDGKDREQGLALAYHALGRKADSDAALKRLIERAGTEDPFSIAEVYAYRGEADESFRWLEFATRGTGPVRALPAGRMEWEMRASPMLASLHDDPRWETWIADPPR